jgi:acetyl esterase
VTVRRSQVAGELDPEARELLERVAASPPPPPHSIPLSEYRRAAHDLLEISGDAEPLEAVEDVEVDGPEGKLPARAYRPGSCEPGLLVLFHGGGFVRGDLDTHDPLSRRLAAAARCEVLSVAYRLAPEHPFPAAVNDAVAAVEWAAHEYDGPLAVGGDSSGGNLAAVTALAARDRGGPPLAAQLLLYPVTDAALSSPSWDELAEGRMLTRAAMEWLYERYLPDPARRTDPLASPLLASSHAGLPPAIVVTAGHDPARDDGVRYAERLEDAGVAVRHLAYPGTLHNFMLLVDALGVGLRATAEVGRELGNALRNARNSA